MPAAIPVTIFGTGVADDGSALGDDATDSHYELMSNGGTALMPGAARTLTADGFPIGPWVGNGSDSRWIVPIATDNDGNAAVGTFDYRTTFDLTGIDPSTVTISGQWAADNDATILLNGVDTGISLALEDFGALTAFTLSSGFRAGVNTLDFVVHNAGGPTGLRVTSLTGSGESTDQVAAGGVGFNTGVDDAGQPLAAGAIDSHWTVVDAPDASLLGATTVVPGDAYPFPRWVGDDSDSQWIAPQGAAADASAPPGTYKYQTALDLTGYDPSTAVLSGRWSADNEGVNVYLNGVPLNLSVTGTNPGSGVEAYRGYADLYIANGVNGAVFLPGVNTLTFEVRNDQLSSGDNTANPVGLRVDGLRLSAVELPVISVTALNDATEGGTAGAFRFTRTGDLSSSLTVTYVVGGSATAGTDYTALSGTVTFAAGASTADVSVATIDDVGYEPAETVELAVATGTGYAVGTSPSVTVTITDNEVVPNYWLGGVGGSWFNPANWSNGVPTAASALYFDGAHSNASVTIPDDGSGTAQFAELHLVGGYTGTVTLSNNVTVRNLELASGTLDQPTTPYGCDLTVTAAMLWTGGTLNSTTNLATLTITGSSTLAQIVPNNGGTIILGDSVNVTGGATLSMQDGTVEFNQEGTEIRVETGSGMRVLPGTLRRFILGEAKRGSIQIDPFAELNVQKDAYFQSRSRILNAGTLVIGPEADLYLSVPGDISEVVFEQIAPGETHLYGNAVLSVTQTMQFKGGILATIADVSGNSDAFIGGARKDPDTGDLLGVAAIEFSGTDIYFNRGANQHTRFGTLTIWGNVAWSAGDFIAYVQEPQPGVPKSDSWKIEMGSLTITGGSLIPKVVDANGNVGTAATNNLWGLFSAADGITGTPSVNPNKWLIEADGGNPIRSLYLKAK